MTVIPTPPLLATPIVNAKRGGFIRPVPYLSPSQYRYAPTAMDTDSLDTLASAYGEPSEQDQVQVLTNVIARATGCINDYVFGVDPSPKGASLCASQNVEDGRMRVMQGFFNLQCMYGPLISLDACQVGSDPSNVVSIAQSVAAMATFGSTTIKVPALWPLNSTPGPTLVLDNAAPDGKSYVVWTYTNGYPHMKLAATANSGQDLIQVQPNGPGNTILGVFPGDVLTIDDATAEAEGPEDFTVQSISGTTITATSNLLFTHTLPNAPDFIPVTAMPAEVTQAAIFYVTALIKSRGDMALELSGVAEPNAQTALAEATLADVKWAQSVLDKYATVSKLRS